MTRYLRYYSKFGGIISTSLKNLFSKIKRLRKFSTAWKIGIVSPLFEDGDQQELSNNRPVTLLNTISKIFEISIFRAIAELFVTTISNNQYDFWPRRFVVVQLLYSLTQIYSIIGAPHSHNLLVLFDFSKAFDKIKQSIICQTSVARYLERII